MSTATTSKLAKAQKWAQESIGKHHRVRVNKNTVWAGKIIEAEVVSDPQTRRPLYFKIMMATEAGSFLGPFHVRTLPA